MSGGKFRVVKTVSLFHSCWGTIILSFYVFGLEMPRPFGSQEAFLLYMPSWVMAVMMLAGAVFCQYGLLVRGSHPFRTVLCVAPQQLILLWSTMWGLVQLATSVYFHATIDERGLLALGYLVPVSLFHGLDIVDLWGQYWARRLAENAK